MYARSIVQMVYYHFCLFLKPNPKIICTYLHKTRVSSSFLNTFMMVLFEYFVDIDLTLH